MTNSVARTISGFEAFQFGVTRFVALAVSIVAWVAILCVLVFLALRGFGSGTYVSSEDVRASLATATAANGATAGPTSTYSMPDNLKDYFSGDNKPILEGWLEGLDSSQQQDFLDNLSQIVAQTHKEDPSPEVNAYKNIKLKRLGAGPYDQYVRVAEIVGAVSALLAFLFLIILTSLVLVLLAIERNTRRTHDEIDAQGGGTMRVPTTRQGFQPTV